MPDENSPVLVERMARSEMSRLFQPSYSPDNDPNNSILTDCHEYALYFNQLDKMFELLIQWYRSQEKSGGYEAKMVKSILEKFLNTVNALTLKYTYNMEHRLRVDLTDSGFPNFIEIDAVRNDFMAKDIRLGILPPASILKSKLLEYLFQKRADSPEILAMLSERSYLESLSLGDLLMTFTPGDLIVLPQGREASSRSYVYSWACYDFKTNRPYIHIMNFDQDIAEEPLENRGGSFAEFCEVVQGEGSRAPQLAILAMAIDDRLVNIHPKIIKRICLGPLYSRFLMGNIEDSADPWFNAFKALMENFGQAEDDGVLLFTDEIIISSKQQKVRQFLSSRMREIFHIPENDLECYSRQASVVHHNALLPHYLLQHVNNDSTLNALGFNSFSAIPFSKGGVTYG
ncbi:MAG: hypothetical protein WCT26_02630 [Candidatus Buchananbacteria bacterium]|jgi:hypothetical protein